MDKNVVVGQLIILFRENKLYGVITQIYDDHYQVLLENGDTWSKITETKLSEELKRADLINFGSKLVPVFKNGKPVMCGKRTVGYFKKREVYTFEPVEAI